MKQYLGGIVEAVKSASNPDVNPNDVETVRFYAELGNDAPDSQWPNVLVAIARIAKAVADNPDSKKKFTNSDGWKYIKDAQHAIMAELDHESEELVEKRG